MKSEAKKMAMKKTGMKTAMKSGKKMEKKKDMKKKPETSMKKIGTKSKRSSSHHKAIGEHKGYQR